MLTSIPVAPNSTAKGACAFDMMHAAFVRVCAINSLLVPDRRRIHVCKSGSVVVLLVLGYLDLCSSMGASQQQGVSLSAVTAVLLLLMLFAAAQHSSHASCCGCTPRALCLRRFCPYAASVHCLQVGVQLQWYSFSLLFEPFFCVLGAWGITYWRHSIMILFMILFRSFNAAAGAGWW
jgi:hypothetical protein